MLVVWIADPLEILGAKQEMRTHVDVAQVLHHVSEEFAEDRVVHSVAHGTTASISANNRSLLVCFFLFR